jgi:hypothetical protein
MPKKSISPVFEGKRERFFNTANPKMQLKQVKQWVKEYSA